MSPGCRSGLPNDAGSRCPRPRGRPAGGRPAGPARSLDEPGAQPRRHRRTDDRCTVGCGNRLSCDQHTHPQSAVTTVTTSAMRQSTVDPAISDQNSPTSARPTLPIQPSLDCDTGSADLAPPGSTPRNFSNRQQSDGLGDRGVQIDDFDGLTAEQTCDLAD